MNAQTKISLGKIVVIFIGMVIIFAALLVTANLVSGSFAQLALVSVGSAILSSGVTFFLIRVTQ